VPGRARPERRPPLGNELLIPQRPPRQGADGPRGARMSRQDPPRPPRGSADGQAAGRRIERHQGARLVVGDDWRRHLRGCHPQPGHGKRAVGASSRLSVVLYPPPECVCAPGAAGRPLPLVEGRREGAGRARIVGPQGEGRGAAGFLLAGAVVPVCASPDVSRPAGLDQYPLHVIPSTPSPAQQPHFYILPRDDGASTRGCGRHGRQRCAAGTTLAGHGRPSRGGDHGSGERSRE